LFTLERLGILSPQQREIVIERMLALDADELDTEQLKWVVLMVLSSHRDRSWHSSGWRIWYPMRIPTSRTELLRQGSDASQGSAVRPRFFVSG
jgi:Uncharacterized protein conserved in bacteria